MTSRRLQIGMAILLGVLVVPGLAQARQHGRSMVRVRIAGNGHYYAPTRHYDAYYGEALFYLRHHDDYDDDDGYHGYARYGDSYGRPPGWDRGRKVGWGGCNLPPGLAKKYGCYAYYHDSHYYRPNGTIISVTVTGGK